MKLDKSGATQKQTRAKEATDWRLIAEGASQEQDPKRLIQLVEDLCHELERSEEALNHRSARKLPAQATGHSLPR